MTITTQTAVSVGAAVMDAVPVSIARDFLQGYTGDYYFFQYSQVSLLSPSEYILITGTDLHIDEESGELVTGDEFTVFDITALVQPVSHTYTDNFDGTILSVDPASFSGQYVRTESEDVTQWLTQVYTVDHQIELHNDGVNGAQFLVYSSFGNNPRLIEGGQNYAYAQTLIMLSCIAFGLISLVFRHVSN